MKRIYWIILILIVVIIAASAYFVFGKKKEAAYEWRSGKIERGDIRVVVTATGTLNADTTVQVGTQVSGIIKKIFVDFNSVVKKGQIIAQLDTTYLAAAVEDASSSLYRTQVQVNLTKRNHDRNKKLFEEKVIAQADFDQSLSDYESAVAGERSAKSSLDRAIINLRYATIIAPVSGVVISRNVDIGQTVAASFSTPTLFAIANDLSRMQVQASIDEADIGKIQVGQDVSFTVDAYIDQIFTGKVRQIRLQPIVLQNVVNYTVIIDVPNPELKLMPGMTANITVKIQEAQNVMKVPVSAVRFWPPQDWLDKHMEEIPDTVKKMIERLKKFRERSTGQTNSGQNLQGMGGGQGGGSQGGSQGFQGRGEGYQGQHSGKWGGGEGMKGKMNIALVWVKQGTKLVPYRVHTGMSDGSFTEITGQVKEGDEIITGIVNTNQANPVTQQQSPFQPQMRPAAGRGGR